VFLHKKAITMKSNIAVGIIKPNLGGNSLLDAPFQSFTKGSFNCVVNVGLELEIGDVVHNMWGDINTWWPDAIYNGGSILDITNYTPLLAIDLEYNCTIPVDATVSDWSDWSTCVSGSQTRTRTVITPASGGGNTPSLIETQACTTVLPLLDFYYEGFWPADDVQGYQPEINSWVDYLDENGVEHRFIVGANENGCQLVQASSIVDTNGCGFCNANPVIGTQFLQNGETSLGPDILVYYKDYIKANGIPRGLYVGMTFYNNVVTNPDDSLTFSDPFDGVGNNLGDVPNLEFSGVYQYLISPQTSPYHYKTFYKMFITEFGEVLEFQYIN